MGGIGGTLAGNALSLAAMRVTLTEVLTDEAFGRMMPLADRWADGVDAGIAAFGLPWHCNRLGARGEYTFSPPRRGPGPRRTPAGDFDVEQFLHLYCSTGAILLTPFHNMALMSPATTEADVDRHTEVFGEALLALTRGTVPALNVARRSDPTGSPPMARVGHGGANRAYLGCAWSSCQFVMRSRRRRPGSVPHDRVRRSRLVVPTSADARLQDPPVLDEIELYGDLVIAASASDQPLSRDEIDRVLGLGHRAEDESRSA